MLGLWEGLSHSALLHSIVIVLKSHSASLRSIVIVLKIVAAKTNLREKNMEYEFLGRRGWFDAISKGMERQRDGYTS